MSTLTIIVLTSLVIGFIYRALKLYELIKEALYYFSLNKDVTPTNIQFHNSAIGCVCFICFPCVCFFFITPIFLFFKVDWWIPLISYVVGLTIGNMIGFIIERIIRLPNHETDGYCSFNLNAAELIYDDGHLYRRAIGLMIIYSVISFVISLIIINKV